MKVQYVRIVGGKILLMSEEADLCLLMKVYFLRKGCKVFTCHTLEDVLHSVGKIAPDCVIVHHPLAEGRERLFESLLEQSPSVQLIVCNDEILYDKPAGV